jgi:outer membrane protein OmpA-like peptidoglycan-associated protein
MPVYTVTVVARTIKAVNYHHRSGSTKIDFRGTALQPEARGEAKVESKQGVIKIDAEMERLQPASRYGPEYLTYVMWAITPEGRATNLGEVLLHGDKSKLNTTTDLQSFGLVVTAEPYFAVTQPSDVVVMENFIRRDTTGNIQDIEAKYELLPRGQYVLNVRPAEIPMRLDSKVPLELYEARNAVRIARWTGAERYAADTYLKAVQGLENAEGYLHGKAGKKPIGTVAREAAQMAEDARIITIKKMEEERLANERAAAADREARAKADAAEKARLAELETQRRSQAEADRAVAEQERRAAERAKRDALQAKLEAEQATQAAQNAAALASREKADALAARADAEAQRAAAEAQRAAALNQQQAAQADADRARSAASEADRLRQEALAQQQAAQAEAERARLAAGESDRLRQKAEDEKVALRAQLLQQLNAVLETRDSARGLIVNMSDVLFDTGKYTLRPGAREKLAKIAGIVLAHPSLRLEVEGHTDSVGGDEYNQRLSENRATAVRDYLVRQGVSSSNVTARGFGKSMPVVSNDTASGRQQNRRVELVVSGDAIGGGRLGPSASIPRR